VGFTALSSRLSAPDLVKKLNSVFTEFDLLCSELGLEKIKTIGDAYMVVGGIPNARPDHAKATIMMAIGMQKIIQKHREIHQDNLDIRIGVHTGPLVAGVIGKNKFAYDTWGDTVNTASSMESHAIAGRIQVSESTAELIKQDFELEDRGIIDIKGKGGMRTWLVKDTKSNFKRS
jgi:class 3 adenylate cyclase